MKYLLSKIYGLIVSFRVFLYQRGLLRSYRLNHPVISVGNLTVGGTGKTPLVGFLAQILKKAGYQPVILSRGYKRSNNSPVLLVSDLEKVLCGPEETSLIFWPESMEGCLWWWGKAVIRQGNSWKIAILTLYIYSMTATSTFSSNAT